MRLEFEQKKWKEEMELKMNEKAHRESPAVKIKTSGDVLRITISLMPNEGINVVTWLKGLCQGLLVRGLMSYTPALPCPL